MARKRTKAAAARPSPEPQPKETPVRAVEPAPEGPKPPPQRSFAEAFLPKGVRGHALYQRWIALPAERRDLLSVVAVAALVFIPWLGSVGLWDPWETHYGEVARSLIVREDWVHPYWERAYFFSKPILPMWLMGFGMKVVGALDGPRGALSIYTEWAMRLPFALLAIGGVVSVYLAGARVFSRRVGLIAAVALATMPVYALLARQAVTDMPFVSLVTAALACFMVAVFGREEGEDPSAPWLYAFYALAGFAALAKGLLGIALPGAVIFAWMAMTSSWRLLPRLRIPTGALVTAAVAAPWYTAMILFDGKDEEFKTFFVRFFIHDHFKRLAAGVHTTTPGGTFTYYVEQLGFGIFPWVAVIPGALAVLSRVRPTRSREDSARLFVLMWGLVGFLLFTLAATKFHHYAFPIVPALALMGALFVVALWDEGLERHYVPLILGAALFAVVAQNLTLQPKHLADLFVYNYERPYPHREVDPRTLFGLLFGAAGVAFLAAWLWRSRRALIGTLVGLAAVFALYVSWVHWVDLSPHWSQRDLFWTYYQDRQAEEPIAAYYMNWRGETFYSQNSVHQIKDASKLRRFVAAPGPEYVLVEQARYKGMRSVLGSRYDTRILDRSNNKFYLVKVEDGAK